MEPSLFILLADDDADDREFFSEALQEISVNGSVALFRDGRELMEFIDSEAAGSPHILFLDLNMPCKGGLECLQEIRQKAQFAQMPIAIYSTSSSERDIDLTYQHGATVYIKKPNDFGKLKKMIHHIMREKWPLQNSPVPRDQFVLTV